MIKKIFLFISFFLFFLVSIKSSFAQEIFVSSTSSEFSSSSAIVEKESNESNYQLPYPGILPDNPLYPLKALRDRVISFLITSPVKKAEFDIHEADKRLNTGIYLIKKGNYDLAESTVSKGENYFEDAFGQIKEAKKEGLDTKNVVDKLKASVEVHKKYISEMKSKSPKDLKGKFETLEKRVDKFISQAKTI